MAGSSGPEHSDAPDELLPDGATGSPGQRWWRLQALGALGFSLTMVLFGDSRLGLDISGEQLAGIIIAVSRTLPGPAAPAALLVFIAFASTALIGLFGFPLGTYFHSRALSRRDVSVDVTPWVLISILSMALWPVSWYVVWRFREFRSEVSV